MEDNMSTDTFLDRLIHLAWFEQLGRPNKRDDDVKRIKNWSEWPGPEDTAVRGLTEQSQYWHDAIFASAGNQRDVAQNLWKHVQQVVFDHASLKVPYDSKRDAWYGPTQCVWDAAYAAGLVGCHILLGRNIPPQLAAEWFWYEAGHWPCGYADDRLERLLVY